jgi:hypothetical protein
MDILLYVWVLNQQQNITRMGVQRRAAETRVAAVSALNGRYATGAAGGSK